MAKGKKTRAPRRRGSERQLPAKKPTLKKHAENLITSQIENLRKDMAKALEYFEKAKSGEEQRIAGGASRMKRWIGAVGARTAYVERGSPWENGYVESFKGRLRDELLNGEIFTTLKEAQIVIEGWRQHYNRMRPHSSLGYKPPAPEIVA
jgi:hypothetical protein